MNFGFHPEAQAEFEATIEWYEQGTEGLGLDYASEVYAAIQRARRMPMAWPLMGEDVRRVLVNRFPYGVLYVPHFDNILLRLPEIMTTR
jgi:hypothetical protein